MSEITAEEWRAEALKCRRIVQALPDCLTAQAIREVRIYLACELNDDEAVAELDELVYRGGPRGAE